MISVYNDEKWIGQKFNMLTVVSAVKKCGNGKSTQWFWKVRCDCGNETIAKPSEVVNGKVVSCGCYRKNRIPNYQHGDSHTRLHNIWVGINKRCNPESGLSGYGKRGISICEEWKSYPNFKNWALNNGYADEMTIERKDVNGDYCPENCTWITLGEQARNRRTTHWVEYKGERMSLAEACERAGLPYKQVFERISKSGWSVEDALSTPMKSESDLHRKCRERGINYHTVYSRIHNYGWSEEDALNTPSVGKGANQSTYRERNEKVAKTS